MVQEMFTNTQQTAGDAVCYQVTSACGFVSLCKERWKSINCKGKCQTSACLQDRPEEELSGTAEHV